MAKKLYPEESIQAIASAIRSKSGGSETYTVGDMATAIANLPSGGDDSVLIDLIERDITSINIPVGTTKVGKYAFQNCDSLLNAEIPNGVTQILQNAFYGCIRMTNVNVPNGVSLIGAEAFRNCSSLTSIDIPPSVVSIGNNAFRSCQGFETVIVRATNPPSLGSNAFTDTPSNANIYVPAGSVDAYKAASGWSDRADHIQAIPES